MITGSQEIGQIDPEGCAYQIKKIRDFRHEGELFALPRHIFEKVQETLLSAVPSSLTEV